MPFDLAVIIALAADLLFGDPPWVPHPVRLMGGLAARVEGWTRKLIRNGFAAGGVTVIVVLLTVGGVVSALIVLSSSLYPPAGVAVCLVLLYSSLAIRDMLVHARRVHAALTEQGPDLETRVARARERVAWIVGRDTGCLDEKGIVRACVESVAESMVDGITAPLFWAFCGAILADFFAPGQELQAAVVMVMQYKAVNTMDSMFGYKNDRYLEFGFTAARLDDLANYLPARLSALVMIPAAALLSHGVGKTWQVMRRDRRCHTSPNAGYTEAAMAGALEVTLGGANSYFGKRIEKPFIGDGKRPLTPARIVEANRMLMVSSLLFCCCLLLFHGLLRFVLG